MNFIVSADTEFFRINTIMWKSLKKLPSTTWVGWFQHFLPQSETNLPRAMLANCALAENSMSESQWQDQNRDYESYRLSDETETKTKNTGLKIETETKNTGLKIETETDSECKSFLMIYDLIKGLQWKSNICRQLQPQLQVKLGLKAELVQHPTTTLYRPGKFIF